MKRILAVVLTSVLLTGGSVSAVSANATTEALPVSQMETVAEMQNNLYLVPGTYMSGGVKVENTVTSGATKLTSDECEEILTDNAYLCNLSVGDSLPVPTSERVDKNGVPYKFNGWW